MHLEFFPQDGIAQNEGDHGLQGGHGRQGEAQRPHVEGVLLDDGAKNSAGDEGVKLPGGQEDEQATMVEHIHRRLG